MFADESTVMELLIHAGQARSDAMEAIAASRRREWGPLKANGQFRNGLPGGAQDTNGADWSG